MKFYKIQRTDTGQWMQSGGAWTNKEDTGKVWKKLNHVKSSITNAKYNKRFVSPESFPDVEIVVYEVKETRRIKLN